MSHMDVARVVLDAFVKKLTDISKVERPPKMEGRRLGLLLLSTAPPRPHDHKPEKATDKKDDAGEKEDGKKHLEPPHEPPHDGPNERPPGPSADGTPPAAPTTA
jgi:hypothetical protein